MFKRTYSFIASYYQVLLISIALWCILNESIQPIIIIEGIVMGLITAHSINFLLGRDNHYAKHNSIPFLIMIRYTITLFTSIYKSTIAIIKIILFENPVPRFVKVNPNITNEWVRCLIANSITLTPGTVSVEDNGNEIIVLWIKPTTSDRTQFTKIIQGDFEEILKTVED